MLLLTCTSGKYSEDYNFLSTLVKAPRVMNVMLTLKNQWST